MLLDCLFSPTHAPMAHKWLIPSATSHGMTVRCHKMARTLSGDYDAPGTLEMYLSEFARLLTMEPCTGAVRLIAGADMVFFMEWPSYCRDYMGTNGLDMCFAWDSYAPCMDFICFVDRLDTRAHLLNCVWTTFCKAQAETPAGNPTLAFFNNQFVNAALIKSVGFRWGCFPTDVVCNWASIAQTHNLWSGEPFSVPATARVFHANWTLGVENKERLLAAASCHELQRMPSGANPPCL
jgi:hypothetical protein